MGLLISAVLSTRFKPTSVLVRRTSPVRPATLVTDDDPPDPPPLVSSATMISLVAAGSPMAVAKAILVGMVRFMVVPCWETGLKTLVDDPSKIGIWRDLLELKNI